MALVSIPGGAVMLPEFAPVANTPPLLVAGMTFDNTADRTALIFRAWQAMTITHVAFTTFAVTASEPITIEVQTVSATTGYPTGTLWAANTSATQVTPAANTTYEVALTASASLNAGDVVAIVLSCQSGSPNLQLAMMTIPTLTAGGLYGHPYAARNTSGSYSMATGLGPGDCIYVKDSVLGYLNFGASKWAITETTALAPSISTSTGATTGTKRGMRFKVPFKCQMAGVVAIARLDGDCTFDLYNDSGTLLSSSATFDKDQRGTGNVSRYNFLYLSTPQTLTPETYYRAVIVPTTTTALTLREFTVPSSALWKTVAFGSDWLMTAYINSAWDDTATLQRPWMSLLLSQFDDGAAVPSGGGLPVVGGSVVR